MPRSVRIHAFGDADAIRIEDIVTGEPGAGDGTLRPTIARTFAFDQIADAHRFIEAGEQIGKIIVTL